MKKIIVCLMLSLVLMAIPSFAAETMDVLYSYDENKITINASTDIPNCDVAVYVLRQGENPDDMGTLVMPVAADFVPANSEGKMVNYEMYFSGGFAYGTYNVYLYYGTVGVQQKSFSYLSPQERIMNAVRASTDWDQLRTAIMGTDENGNSVNDHFGHISPDLTYYNKLVSKSQVFVRMYSRKGEINSFGDIAPLFYSISRDCYSDENKPQGGGGGGGGGSSMGSYPVKNEQATTPVPNTPQTELFGDMSGHWARETVYAMAHRGIINGFENGDFLPEKPVTRAEFTKMTVCAFGLLGDAPNIFEDVEDGIWYEEYISAAAQRGIVSGSNGKFYPENKITREDAAVILYNVLNGLGGLGGNTRLFDDMSEVSEYAGDAVSILAGNNIISGTTGTTFSPKKDTTRAEAATLIYRAYEFYAAR